MHSLVSGPHCPPLSVQKLMLGSFKQGLGTEATCRTRSDEVLVYLAYGKVDTFWGRVLRRYQ
jgi:hypothetical protein